MWSCAAATSTSAWPSCRWSRTAARRCPATTAGRRSTPRHRCRTCCRGSSPRRSGCSLPSCGSSLRRSAAASAARPGCAPSTRPSPPRPATSAGPSRGCPTRRRRPRLAPAQPRPDPVRRARLPARRHVHRAPRAPRRRRRRLPGHRRLPTGRHQADGQRHVPLPRHPVRRRRRRDQHDADGRLPGRRPARGDGAARTPRRPRRPSNWPSTRSSCAAATSSPTTSSRSGR